MDGSAVALIAPETNREILIDYIRAKGRDRARQHAGVELRAGAGRPNGPPDIRIEIGPGGAAFSPPPTSG